MSQVSVTVIMPLRAYYPEYLSKSLGSVRAQTRPHWRMLIVVEEDDRETFTDLLRDELTDERISLVVNRGRKLAGAINTGMQVATTEFVALLLADDMWSPDAVEVLNRYIRQFPQADFFHSARVVIDSRDQVVSPVYPSAAQISLGAYQRGGSPVKHLLCWRRSLALELGGLDETLNSVGPDDYDFPWMMAEAGARFQAVRECLYLYRNHCDCYRLTTHLPLWVHRHEVGRIMKKHNVGFFRRHFILAKRRWHNSLGGQCLYRSRFAWWWRGADGHDPGSRWRTPTYRR